VGDVSGEYGRRSEVESDKGQLRTVASDRVHTPPRLVVRDHDIADRDVQFAPPGPKTRSRSEITVARRGGCNWHEFRMGWEIALPTAWTGNWEVSLAGAAKERIRDWMRRRFPPRTKQVHIYECADVTQLLDPGDATDGLTSREGMLFSSREHVAPAPRKEVVILTSVLANYSVERIVTVLERYVAPNLDAQPQLRILLGDDLRVVPWGRSSTGVGEAESEPCEAPHPGSRQPA
jgi:hypothetical protein